MYPNTPAWQIVSEALRPQPDLDKLERLSIECPDENELLTICRDHGILLIINHTLKGQLHRFFSANGLEQWRAAVASCTLASLILHRELQRLLPLFAVAEIPVVPFKGPVLSEQLYGDPILRMFSDLDLLVPSDQVCTLVDLLIGEDYLPVFNPEKLHGLLHPGSQIKHCVMQHSSGRWLIEVHWELFSAWRRSYLPKAVENGWSRLEIDEAVETLLYLCLHGAHHWWLQLKWVVDVDRYVRFAHDLDWEDLFTRARERGCVRVVRLALFLARQNCGLELPEWVAAELKRDHKVAILARRVTRFWSRPNLPQPSLPWKFCYLLTCRERLSDKIGMIIDYPLKRSLSF